MTNREKINRMSNDELAFMLCDLMDNIGNEAEEYGYDNEDDIASTSCQLCPMREYCKKGKNGFSAWLDMEVK